MNFKQDEHFRSTLHRATDSGGDPGPQPGDPGPAPSAQPNGRGGRRGKLPPLPHEPVFRPWECIDPATLPPRDFIYGSHYIRRFASVILAPGGGSKSVTLLGEAVSLATGRAILGIAPKERQRVVYFNAEDPADETNRRVLAICQHFGIPQKELSGWLFTESGRDQPLVLATGPDGDINEAVFEMIERWGAEHRPGVVSFDPLSAMTWSPETNEVFRLLGRRLSELASKLGISVMLAHHTRKLGGREANAEDSRGGSALVDAVRSARVLNPMTRDEAPKARLSTHVNHFRVSNGKINLTPPVERSDWYRRVSVSLPNGDNVAVVERWLWPDTFEGVTTADALRVQRAIAASSEPLFENSQAKAWAGNVVAATLGIRLTTKAERQHLGTMIAAWVENDVLRVEIVKDARRGRDVSLIVVGDNRLDEAE